VRDELELAVARLLLPGRPSGRCRGRVTTGNWKALPGSELGRLYERNSAMPAVSVPAGRAALARHSRTGSLRVVVQPRAEPAFHFGDRHALATGPGRRPGRWPSLPTAKYFDSRDGRSRGR
jgi:hypothetical protein